MSDLSALAATRLLVAFVSRRGWRPDESIRHPRRIDECDPAEYSLLLQR